MEPKDTKKSVGAIPAISKRLAIALRAWPGKLDDGAESESDLIVRDAECGHGFLPAAKSRASSEINGLPASGLAFGRLCQYS